MGRRAIWTVTGGLLIGVPAAIACGPHFPWQLLDDRQKTLGMPPYNAFTFEAQQLTPRRDRLAAMEHGNEEGERRAAEARGEMHEIVRAIGAMRASAEGVEAYSAGEKAPEEVRLYTAGAVDFRNQRFEDASDWFARVLVMPEEEAKSRLTWAAYMMGRASAALGSFDAAVAAFKLTREKAIAGAPDPLGLAVASFGEEAKLYYDRAKQRVEHAFPTDADETEGYGGDIAAAVRLYGEQAARGSQSGVNSLRFIASHLTDDPARLKAATADALTRRLLAIYILPQFGDRVDGGDEARRLAVDLAEAIERYDASHAAPNARLAAIVYGAGRYDLAKALAQRSAGPTAAWVLAKIAVQSGDLELAARHYAEAANGFPHLLGEATSERIGLARGEHAVLTLARGQYLEAFDMLLSQISTYWGDVVHLAERVLTTDELKSVVDARLAEGSLLIPKNTMEVSKAGALLDLLARRLVRAGRISEAQTYFQAFDARWRARTYSEQVSFARSRTGIEAAKSWFAAARLAREQGMEMMGHEGPPDFTAWEGGYDGGIGQERLPEVLVSSVERKRFEESRADPDKRFHYRYVAVRHANAAADNLPARSQAFAAVLCHAALWVIKFEGGAEVVTNLYRRYVRDGAHVPFAAHFGRECPEPDFAAAAKLEAKLKYERWIPFVDTWKRAIRYGDRLRTKIWNSNASK